MKIRRVWFSVYTAFLVLVALITLRVVSAGIFLYPATCDHQSSFIEKYAAGSAIDAFRAKDQAVEWSTGMSSAAGRDCVTLERTIEPSFAMRSDRASGLTTALSDGIRSQLRASRAEIVAQSGSPDTGFRFEYKAGTVAGTVSLLPVAARKWMGTPIHLPAGTDYMAANIVIQEKWFPPQGWQRSLTRLLP